jgi:O-antigen ligase
MIPRLVWFGMLVIVVVSPTQYGVELAKNTYVSVADPLVWLVFGLWILGSAIQRRLPETEISINSERHPVLRGPPLMIVLFILIAALSVIGAIHPMKGVKDIVQLTEYFVVAFMLFATIPDRQRMYRVTDLFLLVASAVILLGVVQYLLPGVTNFKVSSSFGNRNVFGGYMALVVPFMAGIALYETSIWRRVWMLTMVTLALLITLSGGALLAITLTLAVLCAMRGKSAFITFSTLFIVIMVLILPRLPRHNDVVLDQSIRLFNDNNEVSLRYTEWQAAGVMISEHPWLGVGIGNYQDNIGGYFGVLPRPTGVVEHDSENLYLVLASSSGLPGLAAFLGMLLTFGIMASRQFFTPAYPRDRGLALGLLGSILSFALCGIWHPLLVRGLGIPLAIMFALAFLLDHASTSASTRHDVSR